MDSAVDLHAIGPRIRVRRRDLDLTLSALASLSGVHRNTISQIERGLLPNDLEALARIAAALGVDIDELARPLPTHDR